MPNWNEILEEAKGSGSTFDLVRRKYLQDLYHLTGRNVIIYYSGWLQKPDIGTLRITDGDKVGFMTTIHQMDRKKGLDLILHTPGGEVAATESIVEYLRSMFGTNIRAIVPELALSAGTMIACACKSILMGQHSSLGPIDPFYMGLPTHGVIEEFLRAHSECKEDPSKIPIWQPIISKYTPALVGECEKAFSWSVEIVREWLLSGMLKRVKNPGYRADSIISELSDHALPKSHSRHLSVDKCKEIGLKIEDLEKDDKLQTAVFAVHYSCIVTLESTQASKIIENHKGIAHISGTPMVVERR